MPRKEFIDGKLNVAFKTTATEEEIEKAFAELKLKRTQVFPNDTDQEARRIYVVTTPKGSENEVVRELKEKYPLILKYAERTAARRCL